VEKMTALGKKQVLTGLNEYKISSSLTRKKDQFEIIFAVYD
jgi:hypothetical protein